MESSKSQGVANGAVPSEQPAVGTLAKLCRKLTCKATKVPIATPESPGKKAKGSGLFATLAGRGPTGRDLQSLQCQLRESLEAAAVLQKLLQATKDESGELQRKLNVIHQTDTEELAGLWRALRLNKKAGKGLVAQLQTVTSRRQRLETIVRNLTTLHENKVQAFQKKHAEKLAEQRRVMDEERVVVEGALRQATLKHTKALQDLTHLEAQRVEAVRDLEKANEEAKEQQASLQTKDAQIERLQTRVALLQQQVWDGNRAANEHRKELEAQTLKMNGVERRLQKRGEDIDRLRDEKDQLEVELAELRSVGSETPTDPETAAMREEIAKLRTWLLRMTSPKEDPANKDEVREHEAATLAAQTAARDALAVARELGQQVMELRAEVSRLTEKAREDEEMNRTLDNEILELVQALEDKKMELQTSRSTVESLQRSMEAEGSEAVAHLTQELNEQRDYLTQACAAADAAEDQVQELQDQLKMAQQGQAEAETAASTMAEELERVKEIAQEACAAADKADEEAAEERRQKAIAQHEADATHARANDLEQQLEAEKEKLAVADTAAKKYKEKSKLALAAAVDMKDAAEKVHKKLKEERQAKEMAQQAADKAQATSAGLEQQLKQEQEARATAEAHNAQLLLQLQAQAEASRLQTEHIAQLEAKLLALEAAAGVAVPSPLPVDVPSSAVADQQKVSEPEPVEAIKAEQEECHNRACKQERAHNDAPTENVKQAAPVCLNPTARSFEAPLSLNPTSRSRRRSTMRPEREAMPGITGLADSGQCTASLLPPGLPGKSNLTAAVPEFVPASSKTATAAPQLKAQAPSFQPRPAPMGNADHAAPQHARAGRQNAVPSYPQGGRFQGQYQR